jgi:hypothetical protein
MIAEQINDAVNQEYVANDDVVEASSCDKTMIPNQRRTSSFATKSSMPTDTMATMTVTATSVAINMSTVYCDGYYKM